LNEIEIALIYSVHHEDVWESGNVAPQVLNLALDWGERSASHLIALPFGKECPLSTERYADRTEHVEKKHPCL
jgi:hypothetical protein